MIGDHEETVAGDSDATVHAACRVSDEPLGSRTLIPPDLATAAGVECVALVRTRDIHDTFDDDRRDLEPRGVEAVDPLWRQPADVGPIDLLKLTITAPVHAAVVAGPIRLRCDLAIARRSAAKQ